MYVPECSLSQVRRFVTPWIVARQALLSREFSRQEYWSGLPSNPPGDLPDPAIKPVSSALQADSLPLSHQKTNFVLTQIHVLFPLHVATVCSSPVNVHQIRLKGMPSLGYMQIFREVFHL